MAKAKITFLPMDQSVECDIKKPAAGEHGLPGSILSIGLANGIRIEHACGGNCACSTCHVVVKKGMDLLSPIEDDEADLLDKARGVGLNSRLACQAVIKQSGEIVIEIPPHSMH